MCVIFSPSRNYIINNTHITLLLIIINFRHAYLTPDDYLTPYFQLNMYWLPIINITCDFWLPITNFTHDLWLPMTKFTRYFWLPIINFRHDFWLPIINFRHDFWLPMINFTHDFWLPMIQLYTWFLITNN